MMDARVFFRRTSNAQSGLRVYQKYDGSVVGYVDREECIELRDLLLREFPIESEYKSFDEVRESPYLSDNEWQRERRERIAMAALPAVIKKSIFPAGSAEYAVECADALIAALDAKTSS